MTQTGWSRRDFCRGMAAGAAGLALGTAWADTAGRGKPCNIVFITTDDQGVEVGCYGDPHARTPHLDALAAEGVLFSRAYVAQASCSPSRSSMLTGLYPHQNGQLGLSHAGYSMHAGIPNLFSLTKEAGYKTGIIGKLHVQPDEEFPFDYDRRAPTMATRMVRQVAEQAAEFLAQSEGDPFFLMVNYFDPHRPYHDADQIDGIPEDPLEPGDVPPFPWLGIDTPEVLDEMAAYYNAVRRLDTGVGLLMKALEDAGHRDDTLVVFLGDHGAPMSRGKTTCYEAGVHIPLIMRWPGRLPEGERRDAFVSTVDLVPTIAAAAGLGLPAPVTGHSLLPLCRDAATPWRDALATEYNGHAAEHWYPRRAIRWDRYQLIHNLLPGRPNPVPGIGPARLPNTAPDSKWREVYERFENPPEFELYDVEADPAELNNLAEDPEYAVVRDRMAARLLAWQRETSDPFLDPEVLREMTEKHDALEGPDPKWQG